MRNTFSFSLIALLSLNSFFSTHLLADSASPEACLAAAGVCCSSITGTAMIGLGIYGIVDGAKWPGKHPRPNLPSAFNESKTITKHVCGTMGLNGWCRDDTSFSCKALEKETGIPKQLCVDGCYDKYDTNQQATCKVYKDYFTASRLKEWQIVGGVVLCLLGSAAVVIPTIYGLVHLCSNN